MNIFQQEDVIKGMPDQALMKEAQAPTGRIPQYLVVSEIQRRADMRKRFAGDQQSMPQSTVSAKPSSSPASSPMSSIDPSSKICPVSGS